MLISSIETAPRRADIESLRIINPADRIILDQQAAAMYSEDKTSKEIKAERIRTDNDMLNGPHPRELEDSTSPRWPVPVKRVNVEECSDVEGAARGRSFPNPEEEFQKAERRASEKLLAQLKAMELAPHSVLALHAEIMGLEQAIRSPESDREQQLCVAKLASVWQRLKVAAVYETRIAPLLGRSKKQAEREAKKGRAIWANLIQITTGCAVDPEAALPYLATLPPDVQRAVAHGVAFHRETWAIEHQIALHKRAIKLDHGTLDQMTYQQRNSPLVRRELSLLDATARAKAVVTARRAEREERKATAQANAKAERERRQREFRSEERYAVAAKGAGRATKAVQAYLTLTPAERADALFVLNLQSVNPN